MNIEIEFKSFPKYRPNKSCKVIYISIIGDISTTNYSKKYEMFNVLDEFNLKEAEDLNLNKHILAYAIYDDKNLNKLIQGLNKENKVNDVE